MGRLPPPRRPQCGRTPTRSLAALGRESVSWTAVCSASICAVTMPPPSYAPSTARACDLSRVRLLRGRRRSRMGPKFSLVGSEHRDRQGAERGRTSASSSGRRGTSHAIRGRQHLRAGIQSDAAASARWSASRRVDCTAAIREVTDLDEPRALDLRGSTVALSPRPQPPRQT